MATNPISWAAPTSSEPLVADLATSAITEGFVRSARKRGLPVPAGTLCEPDGQPTIEAAALYGDPPGFLLPLGGERFGHKGYALSLLVEIIATTLAGDTPDDPGRWGNNLALVALRADEKFVKRADALCSYLRSAPPGDPASKVLLPGEPERLAAERNRHVAVDAATWAEIEALAASAGVDLPPAPSGIQPPSTGSVAPEM
jgi:LDH2 family malate/lactate/ureidoglycolate dehydrogenase